MAMPKGALESKIDRASRNNLARIADGFRIRSGRSARVHLMQMIGWLMIALFVWLFHGPWLTFKRAVDAEDWPSAGARINPHPSDYCRQPDARLARRRHRRQWALLVLNLSRAAC